MDICENSGYNAFQQEATQVSYHLNIMLLLICDSQDFYHDFMQDVQGPPKEGKDCLLYTSDAADD